MVLDCGVPVVVDATSGLFDGLSIQDGSYAGGVGILMAMLIYPDRTLAPVKARVISVAKTAPIRSVLSPTVYRVIELDVVATLGKGRGDRAPPKGKRAKRTRL
jgi:hypothetical protein